MLQHLALKSPVKKVRGRRSGKFKPGWKHKTKFHNDWYGRLRIGRCTESTYKDLILTLMAVVCTAVHLHGRSVFL